MDLLIVLLLTLIMLIFAVTHGIFVGFPLIITLMMFMFLSVRRGFNLKEVILMSYEGSKKALIVLRIFILIGAITGIWLASGTVPAVVYYGVIYMIPKLFVLFAFLISAGVSFLLGTSFGTVGTVGLALMLMAKSGGVDPAVTAGAIMAGAYFGDRASPMSSSANLVAHLTQTELYDNIKLMFKTAALPLLIAILAYIALSILHPFQNVQSAKISIQILENFNISPLVLIPALSILILAFFKVSVRKSMLVSIFLASFLAYFVQHVNFTAILSSIFLGYHMPHESELSHIMSGGGVISMWKAAVVVTVSSALAGIFEKTKMLQVLESQIDKADSRAKQFTATTVISLLTAAIGCNQSISIILTEQLMKKNYGNSNSAHQALAIDIENTGVVLAALIPWNIAAFVPTTTMGVNSYGYLPYAVYLYLIPLTQGLISKSKKNTLQ